MNILKRLLAASGIGIAASAAASAAEFYKPYAEPQANFLYNLLFCDDITLFKNDQTTQGDGLWPTLLAEQPEFKALEEIALNEANEGRVRAIAFNRLRAAGQKVPAKMILGVIVEVPQTEGLDVLAAFAEGGVRYLNQSGKVVVLEGVAPVESLAKELVAVSQTAVDQIGPWDKARLAPPLLGKIRMTFLVSDGLYFGEGPWPEMQSDPLAGPVIDKALALLVHVVEKGTSD